jgi:choline dehydrogenase-like flavoprotein
MGDDPRTSVVNKVNRAHDVRNLFLVDGSSLVTSGRQQPTATIQALAYRASDYIQKAARKSEI